MRREIEFRGHEKFTLFHAAALVFCLDAAGVLLVEACDAPVRSLLQFAWIPFLAVGWYGLLLLVLQRRTPHYRRTGYLMMAVNGLWALQLLAILGREDRLQSRYLGISAVLFAGRCMIVQHAVRIQSVRGGSRRVA